jgi:23S rRNA (adenine2503-C2)-methyltransferase
MEVIHSQGDDTLARVFVGRLEDGACIEFAESVQPPVPRADKWVLIVSTLRGCPVRCPICDAGGDYRGRLSAEEILAQIDHMVRRRYPQGRVEGRRLKIQFARMGDPALNDAVVDVLRLLPGRYEGPEIMPSISTIAPAGRNRFFEDLLAVKRELYAPGLFQLQFSLHSTCEVARRALVPARTWSFAQMARYGERFTSAGDRKVTLNFAPARGTPLDPGALARVFDPGLFVVKLTPINPTAAARRAGLEGLVDPADPQACEALAARFEGAGYETILSIGEPGENEIGSNCGMYVAREEPA